METLLKWMIWGYHHLRKHPYIHDTNWLKNMNISWIPSLGALQLVRWPDKTRRTKILLAHATHAGHQTLECRFITYIRIHSTRIDLINEYHAGSWMARLMKWYYSMRYPSKVCTWFLNGCIFCIAFFSLQFCSTVAIGQKDLWAPWLGWADVTVVMESMQKTWETTCIWGFP